MRHECLSANAFWYAWHPDAICTCRYHTQQVSAHTPTHPHYTHTSRVVCDCQFEWNITNLGIFPFDHFQSLFSHQILQTTWVYTDSSCERSKLDFPEKNPCILCTFSCRPPSQLSNISILRDMLYLIHFWHPTCFAWLYNKTGISRAAETLASTPLSVTVYDW